MGIINTTLCLLLSCVFVYSYYNVIKHVIPCTKKWRKITSPVIISKQSSLLSSLLFISIYLWTVTTGPSATTSWRRPSCTFRPTVLSSGVAAVAAAATSRRCHVVAVAGGDTCTRAGAFGPRLYVYLVPFFFFI